MNEPPDALELIRLARETLLESVLPQLEDDARYHGLMIANALGIAVRELERGGELLQQELDQLLALYGDEAAAGQLEDIGERVARCNGRLARDLRAGAMDGAVELGLRRLLRTRIEGRLSVTNPRFLAQAVRDSGRDAE